MKSTIKVPSFILAVIGVGLAVSLFFLGSVLAPGAFFNSVEVGFTSVSPIGLAGGLAVPASCPSYEHTPGECAPPPPPPPPPGGGNPPGGGGPPPGVGTTTPPDTGTTTPPNQGPPPNVGANNPDLFIDAEPALVRPEEATIINWNTVGVDPGSCSVTGPNFAATGESGSQSTGPLTHESTYTLSCTTEAGPVTESVTVNVVPDFTEI